jgi:carnitine monooxygenase subunit
MATLNISYSADNDLLEGWSLPAWTYDDPEFARLEVERIFRPSWQVVCHVSDVPHAGD